MHLQKSINEVSAWIVDIVGTWSESYMEIEQCTQYINVQKRRETILDGVHVKETPRTSISVKSARRPTQYVWEGRAHVRPKPSKTWFQISHHLADHHLHRPTISYIWIWRRGGIPTQGVKVKDNEVVTESQYTKKSLKSMWRTDEWRVVGSTQLIFCCRSNRGNGI